MESHEIEALIEERVSAILAERQELPVTAIQPFHAIWNRHDEGKVGVKVIGIRRDVDTEASFQFVVVNEDGGVLYCDAVDSLEGELPK